MKTLFLTARPTFLSGAARLFDFAGYYDSYNISKDEPTADGNAMFSDWYMVGSDIYTVARQYEEQDLPR